MITDGTARVRSGIKEQNVVMKYRLARWAVPMLVSIISLAISRGVAETLYLNAGSPTPLEEEIRWRVNRGRFNSAQENQTRGTSYTDVPASAGPLAPNQSLTLASRHHSEDMARNNVFQHATVTGSAYYNPVTQPNPWDRMVAEGYSWNNAGENIAAGYSGAESAYVGWWNSTGHRVNMYNANLREIGNGYYYTSTSSYGRYYTMDLGSSGRNDFFTDTLFFDANNNGVYDAGEGLSGVAVRLAVGSTKQDAINLSSSVGSFAVPINSIAAGATVSVVLSNSAATNITLNLPRDYASFTTLTLAPHQEKTFGTFLQPATTANVGLRSVTPSPTSTTQPNLVLGRSGQNIVLSWVSQTGLQYQPQWSHDALVWSNLLSSAQPGSGGVMTFTNTAPPTDRRFYRLVVQ
jgi:hypothetical protein